MRKRGRTNCGGLEKKAMTLNELGTSQVSLTLKKREEEKNYASWRCR